MLSQDGDAYNNGGLVILYDLLNEEVADCVASDPHHFTTKASKCVMKLRLILIGHQIWPRAALPAALQGRGSAQQAAQYTKAAAELNQYPIAAR